MKKLDFKTFSGFDISRRSSWRFFARQLWIIRSFILTCTFGLLS